MVGLKPHGFKWEKELHRDRFKARYFDGIGLGSTVAAYLLNGATANDIGNMCVEVYKYIVENYEDGCKIWMFGLSRGAYTVRCVAGMINNCGIIDRWQKVQTKEEREKLCSEVYKIYCSPYKEDRPDSPKSATFREIFSRAVDCPIELLGLFDTVGSTGVPSFEAGNGPVYPTLWDQVVSSQVENVYHAVSIHDRLSVFQPCRALADETKPRHPRIEERLFPGCHYDLGRQRFRFLRTFAGSIAEGTVDTLSWPVSREVKPNEVLSNLVLIWMLEKISNTLIGHRRIFGNVDEKIRDLDTQIRNREVSTGSGDVYDQLLDYVPFGYIVDILSLKGLPGGPRAYADGLIKLLLVVRDRRIPDVGADVCDYENFYEQGGQRSDQRLNTLADITDSRYPSKTYDIFKLLHARETDLDKEEEGARRGAEQRRLQQGEKDERHIRELIRQTKHHRLADHDQTLPQNCDATAALVQKAGPTEPQPSQMNQDRNQKQGPTPDITGSNGSQESGSTPRA
ncbi:hypothetical protein V1517DRAFT_332978 [Lipomyces orientalis]|uniref:Uncharacterized protein n=1 Tax=Lipomyces orientalis TaxID=1233043 RepID=A0ACC3TDU5_9ASCO